MLSVYYGDAHRLALQPVTRWVMAYGSDDMLPQLQRPHYSVGRRSETDQWLAIHIQGQTSHADPIACPRRNLYPLIVPGQSRVQAIDAPLVGASDDERVLGFGF